MSYVVIKVSPSNIYPDYSPDHKVMYNIVWSFGHSGHVNGLRSWFEQRYGKRDMIYMV